MAVDIAFPQISKDPAAEGVVATWLAHDGEPVRAGQLIAELMVDKVSVDVEAPADGVLTVLVPEEATAVAGDVIARIG